jgi:hypothetical protein
MVHCGRGKENVSSSEEFWEDEERLSFAAVAFEGMVPILCLLLKAEI